MVESRRWRCFFGLQGLVAKNSDTFCAMICAKRGQVVSPVHGTDVNPVTSFGCHCFHV